jgi:hypothetical protein
MNIIGEDFYNFVHPSWNLRESQNWDYYADILNRGSHQFFPVFPAQGLRVLTHAKEDVKVLIVPEKKEANKNNVGHPLLDKYSTEKKNLLQAISNATSLKIPEHYVVNEKTVKNGDIHFLYYAPYTTNHSKSTKKLRKTFQPLVENIIEELNQKVTTFMFGGKQLAYLYNTVKFNNVASYTNVDLLSSKSPHRWGEALLKLNHHSRIVLSKQISWGKIVESNDYY